jgi:hypothetical protein
VDLAQMRGGGRGAGLERDARPDGQLADPLSKVSRDPGDH